MTPNRRNPSPLRGVLAVGMLAVLAGCRNLPESNSGLGGLGATRPVSDGRITAVQEADMQIALGRSAERRGEFEQAMAAYQSALSRDRLRADAHHRLAILHDRHGKFRESTDLYRRALELQPGSPEIYCDMGYSLYLQGRAEEAERCLRQAIVLQPDHRRAHNNLAMVLARSGRADEALAEFLKGGCDVPQARSNLAFALTLDGRWDLAREQYRLALDVDPSSQIARERLQQLEALVARMADGPDGPSLDGAILPAAGAVPSPPEGGMPPG